MLVVSKAFCIESDGTSEKTPKIEILKNPFKNFVKNEKKNKINENMLY